MPKLKIQARISTSTKVSTNTKIANNSLSLPNLVFLPQCLLLSCILLFACANSGHSKEFSALSFNVQNLFDGVRNNQEYDEYTPPKWTEDHYQKRLVAIGKALQSIKPMPDLIALQEVENTKVVEELQKYYFPSLPHVVVSDNPYSATENALLSKYPILEVRSHNLGSEWARGNRDILDVYIALSKSKRVAKSEAGNVDVPIKNSATNNTVLQVIVVHLKSKRNSTKSDAPSSSNIRGLQYRLIAEIVDASKPTIVLGDFNDDDALRSFEAAIHIISTTSEKSMAFTTYPLESMQEQIDGTYYFRKQWEQIDHILFDEFADKLFIEEKIQVWDRAPFINSKNIPNGFVLRFKNFNAVSDHLPILFSAQY